MTTARKLIKDVKARDVAQSILRDMVDRSVQNRCPFCNCMFFIGAIGRGTVLEVKCPKCGEYVYFGKPCDE